MKLNFFSLEHEMDFSKNNVWRLMVENQGMFINIVNNMNDLIKGIETDERISLYENENIIRWDKEVALIINPWYMYEYEKALQVGIYKYLEREMIYNNKLSVFQEKVNEINIMFSDIISEINLDITYKNIMTTDYLKAIGLKASINAGSAYDNVINLIDAMSYIKGYRLLVLVNSNVYFNKNELLEIIKQVRYNESNILILDMCRFEGKVEDESVIWIDEDFYEEMC